MCQGASTWMQHDTSDLFGITSPAADASNVVALSKANVPMVPMELPTAGIDGDSMIIGKLANLSFAWLGGCGFDGAMLTEISISSVSPGAYIRLAAYASVAFGAQGLLFNCARASLCRSIRRSAENQCGRPSLGQLACKVTHVRGAEQRRGSNPTHEPAERERWFQLDCHHHRRGCPRGLPRWVS